MESGLYFIPFATNIHIEIEGGDAAEDMPEGMGLDKAVGIAHHFFEVEDEPDNGNEDGADADGEVAVVVFAGVFALDGDGEGDEHEDDGEHRPDAP